MATHSSILGKSHGQGSLVGYSPWAARVGHDLDTTLLPRGRKRMELFLKVYLLKGTSFPVENNFYFIQGKAK